MGLDKGTGPILPALKKLHANQDIFSYGISDTPGGIYLYEQGRKSGVLVTGKPARSRLPPPFNHVPEVGLGHQVHHKFVVRGFNGKDPVVDCGSSNLALLGEQKNGDNLSAIYDGEIATVFAIEGLALVDHFDFLDRSAAKAGEATARIKSASRQQQAVDAGWFLSTSDRWTIPYYDPNDLHSVGSRTFRINFRARPEAIPDSDLGGRPMGLCTETLSDGTKTKPPRVGSRRFQQSVLRMLAYIFVFASAAATSRELMSSVIMKPLVPLNSNGFSPAR